jgi:hypothetical protein
MSITSRNAFASPACSVSVPRETPAFATTTSGAPNRAMNSAAARASAAESRTSPAHAAARPCGSSATSASSGSFRRAKRPTVAPDAA